MINKTREVCGKQLYSGNCHIKLF